MYNSKGEKGYAGIQRETGVDELGHEKNDKALGAAQSNQPTVHPILHAKIGDKKQKKRCIEQDSQDVIWYTSTVKSLCNDTYVDNIQGGGNSKEAGIPRKMSSNSRLLKTEEILDTEKLWLRHVQRNVSAVSNIAHGGVCSAMAKYMKTQKAYITVFTCTTRAVHLKLCKNAEPLTNWMRTCLTISIHNESSGVSISQGPHVEDLEALYEKDLITKRIKFLKACRLQLRKHWQLEYLHALEERHRKIVGRRPIVSKDNEPSKKRDHIENKMVADQSQDVELKKRPQRKAKSAAINMIKGVSLNEWNFSTESKFFDNDKLSACAVGKIEILVNNVADM
ncbi:Hypothetical predicted protein, partial [Paramuricea clavata]